MINHELLAQFASKGLTINEGVAIDARLVKSASHPLSQQKLEEEKKKRETPEGMLDKNGNLLKFSRDLESDWTVKNSRTIFRNLPSPQRCIPGEVPEDDQKCHRRPVPADGLQSPPGNQGDQTSIRKEGGSHQMTREQ
jgi:hypothetical protein